MPPPRILAFALALLLGALASRAAPLFNPRDFGAVGDGKTKDTEAIQRAIDAASKAAGTVILDHGVFLSGTLLLKSGVTLRIEKNATLLGSPEHADYRKNRWMALIEAKDQHNIAITGSGVIDGQGEALAADVLRLVNEKKIADPLASNRPAEPNRPQLIEIVNCADVSVQGVTLKNSSCWVQTYIRCERLTLDHVTVRSTSYWNNDGLDIVDCHHATVTHCDIDSADDGICLKSGDSKQGGCEDILVEDCAIRSSASAFKFGTSSRGGFRRITARRLRIHDTFRAAIALESVDGAAIDGVEISDVRATNTGGAIFIRLGHRNKDGEPGSIRNVRISDVTVDVPATAPDANYPHPGPPVRAPHNLFPSSITGLPGHPIGNISLKNITITFAGGGSRAVAEVPLDRFAGIPEQSDRYPEFSMFGELPAWGLYVRHAQDVTMENVVLRATNHDFRSAMVFDDVQAVALHSVHIEGVGDNPIIATKDVHGITVLKTEAPAGAREFIRNMTPNSSTPTSPK